MTKGVAYSSRLGASSFSESWKRTTLSSRPLELEVELQTQVVAHDRLIRTSQVHDLGRHGREAAHKGMIYRPLELVLAFCARRKWLHAGAARRADLRPLLRFKHVDLTRILKCQSPNIFPL